MPSINSGLIQPLFSLVFPKLFCSISTTSMAKVKGRDMTLSRFERKKFT
ncbi:MAG: hypothetical protein ACOCRX_08525 [Candidatus Woesearchaeota archaeon]